MAVVPTSSTRSSFLEWLRRGQTVPAATPVAANPLTGMTPPTTPSPLASAAPVLAGASPPADVPANPATTPVGAPSTPAVSTDSQYEAAQALLNLESDRKRNDILQQLGYTNPATGEQIMGTLETQAMLDRAELERQMGLAQEGVDRQAQQQGTLFSGRRIENRARAEQPYVQGLSQIELDLPRQLSALTSGLMDVSTEQTLQKNQLLAELSARMAELARERPQAPGTSETPETPSTPTTPGVAAIDTMAERQAARALYKKRKAAHPNWAAGQMTFAEWVLLPWVQQKFGMDEQLPR
jgi:hypothetical protein